MKEIINTLKKHDLRTNSYKKIGSVIIVDSNKGKFVLKKEKSDIYDYLSSRTFDYYPKVINDDEYEITEYIEDIKIPKDQKMLDLINLVSLLHNKTTFYKNVDIDDYKKNYEEIDNNISYLNNYYSDIVSVIESKVYMSPAELLLISNISVIYDALYYTKDMLDKWYEIVKDKKRRRFTIIHNNLDLNHFIKNRDYYLISWQKAKIDIPIYDLYKLYKKYALDVDFNILFDEYNKKYKLLGDEKLLFFILISLPEKIEFNADLYETTKKISNEIDYLYKTSDFISVNTLEKTK